MSKGKNFDSDRHLLKQDKKNHNSFVHGMNYLLATVGTPGNSLLKKEWSPQKKTLAVGTVLALVAAGAGGYLLMTKKSTNPVNNNIVRDNVVYSNISAAVDGPAALMKIVPHLNQSEIGQAFAGLATMYPELKASNGTPVVNISQALDSILNCDGKNDYDHGFSIYTVPEKNATIPGQNGSFSFAIKNGTVEKKVLTEFNNSLAKKIYNLALSTKDEPIEWIGENSPSYLAGITDLVELRGKINSLKGVFPNNYIDATDPVNMDKAIQVFDSIPALADLASKVNQGNVSGWDFIDTPDDAVGTPNGGGSVVITYNSTGAVDTMYILDKENTATYNNIIQTGDTRSMGGTRSVEAVVDSDQSYQAKHGKRDRRAEKRAAADISYAKRSIKEMSSNGMYKIDYISGLLAGYNEAGEIKELRDIRSGKEVKL